MSAITSIFQQMSDRKHKSQRINLTVPFVIWETLNELASKRGGTIPDAIRYSIELTATLFRAIEDGKTIVIRDENGERNLKV